MSLSDSRKLLPRKPESDNISSTLVDSGASAGGGMSHIAERTFTLHLLKSNAYYLQS